MTAGLATLGAGAPQETVVHEGARRGLEGAGVSPENASTAASVVEFGAHAAAGHAAGGGKVGLPERSSQAKLNKAAASVDDAPTPAGTTGNASPATSAATGGGKTFKNLFPEDVPGNPVTLTKSQLDKAENVFLYVVREDGALVIGPRSVGGVKQSHIDLAAGGNVRAAGQVKILKGRAHENR